MHFNLQNGGGKEMQVRSNLGGCMEEELPLLRIKKTVVMFFNSTLF